MKAALLAALLVLSALPARAEVCDDIINALSRQADELAKRDVKGGALCVGMGELIGLMTAGRVAATACTRSAMVTDMEASIAAMRQGLPAECK